MKGLVHISILEFIESEFGITIKNKIIEDIGVNNLPNYVSTKTYSDHEINLILTATESVTEIENLKLQEMFGEHFFIELLENYADYFLKINMKDFLIYLNNYIHPEVEEKMSGAITPVFNVIDTHKGFDLTYSSERKMKHFALGLLKSCNEYFNNVFTISMGKSSGISTIFHFVK